MKPIARYARVFSLPLVSAVLALSLLLASANALATLSESLDPVSGVMGRTTCVLNECYGTSGDILLHWSKTSAEWNRFVEIIAWMQRSGTEVVTLHDGRAENSLSQLNDIL